MSSVTIVLRDTHEGPEIEKVYVEAIELPVMASGPLTAGQVVRLAQGEGVHLKTRED